MSHPLTKIQKGDLYILSNVFIGSLFPIISILSYSSLSALHAAAFSTGFAIFFFAGLLTWEGKWREIFVHAAWKDIALTTLTLGILYQGLLFIGLQKTTAGNASIIMLMDFFFSLGMLRFLAKKEKLNSHQVLGSLVMLFGILYILFPGGKLAFHSGDVIILIATFFGPLGDYFTQRARQKVSSSTILFLRSVFSTIFFFALASLVTPHVPAAALSGSIFFLVMNGLVIMGFCKILWVEGIHDIPITKALAITIITPVFTILFAYIFLHEIPTLQQLLGLIPITLGALFLMERDFIAIHQAHLAATKQEST